MWQMLNPTFMYFMKHTDYDFAWALEDDLQTVGKLTVPQILRYFDEKLEGRDADFVATQYMRSLPFKSQNKGRYTYNFEKIIDRMGGEDDPNPPWTSLNPTPRWACISDPLVRHSRRFSMYAYGQIYNHVMAWCECFIQPIAWSGNFTSVDFMTLLPKESGIGVFKNLNKASRKHAGKEFAELKELHTLMLHEKRVHPEDRSHLVKLQL
jgi:hypothetical protein